MADVGKSILSGGIGIPEGAFKLLGNREVERAIGFIVQNITNLEQVINIVQGGVGTIPHARFKANGTKITGSLAPVPVLTGSRTAVGQHTITSTRSADSDGTNFLFDVLVSVSSKAGDGGDGVSPFLAFSGSEAELTDQSPNHKNFFYGSVMDKFYLLGPTSDDVWIHDPDLTGAVQEDALDDIRTVSGEAGVMSKDGTVLWLSGNATTPVRAYNTSTDTWYNFATTDDMKCLAGSDTYVILVNATSGLLERYDPVFATPALGTATRTWSVTVDVGNTAFGVWDGDGNVWFSGSTLILINPANSTARTYAYPVAWSHAFTPTYDSLRNRLIVGGPASGTDIYAFSGWNVNLNDSGDWEVFISGITATAVYHEPTSDVFLVMEPGLFLMHRYFGANGQRIDTVYIRDTTPDNPQVDYGILGGSPLTIVYLHGTTNDSAYLVVEKAGSTYFMRIDYGGSPIPGFGGAAGAVSSVLVPLYEVLTATTAKISLFRSLSPPIYADGEFTVAFLYPN